MFSFLTLDAFELAKKYLQGITSEKPGEREVHGHGLVGHIERHDVSCTRREQFSSDHKGGNRIFRDCANIFY